MICDPDLRLCDFKKTNCILYAIAPSTLMTASVAQAVEAAWSGSGGKEDWFGLNKDSKKINELY